MLTALFIAECFAASLAVFMTAWWSDSPRGILEIVHRVGRFGVSLSIGMIGAFVAQRGIALDLDRHWPLVLMAASLLAVYGPQAVFEQREDRKRATQ